MFRRTIIAVWAALAVGALAACGNTSAPAELASSTAPIPTHAAPTQAADSATTRVAPAPAAEPAATAALPATAGPDAIPEGRTPEGYHLLGRADAPVTLVMYSDFL